MGESNVLFVNVSILSDPVNVILESGTVNVIVVAVLIPDASNCNLFVGSVTSTIVNPDSIDSIFLIELILINSIYYLQVQ